MSLNTDIINTIDIEQYGVPVKVTILEDNKYVVDTKEFKSLSCFIDALLALDSDFKYDGGNSREFYMTNESDVSYTFQIAPFEFDDDLDIGL